MCRVFDDADVAQVDGARAAGAVPVAAGTVTSSATADFDRDVAEFANVFDHRVGRDHRIAVTDPQISGRTDGVAGDERADDVVRRDAVGAQPIRIGADDDAASTSAKGRRSTHAGQG